MKITQIWMEWMFLNLVLCYLSFIIYKIVAYSRSYTNNVRLYQYYTEDHICLILHLQKPEYDQNNGHIYSNMRTETLKLWKSEKVQSYNAYLKSEMCGKIMRIEW